MASTAGVAQDLRQAAKDKKKDVGQMSQWQLMVRRFMQNKLSVLGLLILMGLYVLAAFSGFLAPYHFNELDSNNVYTSPTGISFAGGRPSVCGQRQVLNEELLEYEYVEDCSKRYPIQFFVRGFEYNLLGLFPTNRHLFGVSQAGAPVDEATGKPQEIKLFLFGADNQGRDMLAQILQGARVSLTVGLIGVGIATILGSVLGTASGYFGGFIDNVMQRTIELISSIPQIPLWAALAAALPREMSVVRRYILITVVLSLVAWTGLARQVRGKVMGYRSLDYANATRAAGGSHTRIILTHMLPNAVSHIVVVAALAIPGAILAETALSFLGLGMLRPAVSWGVLLRDAQSVQVVMDYPWLMIPAVLVIITLTCYQFLGDGLRDAVDPYS